MIRGPDVSALHWLKRSFSSRKSCLPPSQRRKAHEQRLGTDIRYRNRWSNRCVLQIRTVICRGKLLRRFGKPGRHIAVRFLACFGRNGLPIRIFFKELEEPAVPRKSLPIRPLRARGNLLSCFDGLPFRGSDHADQVSFYDDLRIRQAPEPSWVR